MLKFCVLGSGISYTLSPKIHNAVFAKLGVKAEYGVTDISKDGLAEHISVLKNEFDGFNVTKPFKNEICKYLNENNARIGAVNTVKRSNGKYFGENTDVYGFMQSLTKMTGDVRELNVLVLGAGGASEAVVCGLTEACADVTIFNRTQEKAKLLADKFGCKWAESSSGLKPELIVNAVSLGNDGVSNPMPSVDLTSLKFAYDLIYSPERTPFLKQCEGAGAKVENGLGMLIYQAIEADEIFLDRRGQLDKEMLYALVEKTIKD